MECDTQPAVAMLAESANAPWYVLSPLLLLVVVVVPAVEEVLFRGIFLPVLAKEFGAGYAMIVISLVFALLHQHVPSYAPLFVLSVGLCLAHLCSGSLVVPIAMHSTFNLIQIAMLLVFRSELPG
jgi:hypothetical protein